MGARKNRSTSTALEWITETIDAVNKSGQVATILSMDIRGAFDNVNGERLIDIMKRKAIPNDIVKYTKCFMTERKASIMINGSPTDMLPIKGGIPQGSPLSPILYIIFAAPLLETLARKGMELKATTIGFVDDTNLISWRNSTETTADTIIQLHDTCEQYAAKHGATFAPEKYQLMHLTQQPAKYNMTRAITLRQHTVNPVDHIRILGVQIDSRRNSKPQMAYIKTKMIRQMLALKCLTASTWGATPAKAKQVYTAVIRPAAVYGADTWRIPGKPQKSLLQTMITIQRKAMITITGAYRATGTETLQKETNLIPIDIYIDAAILKARLDLRNSPVYPSIQTLIDRIKKDGPKKNFTTIGQDKNKWAEKQIEDIRREQNHQGNARQHSENHTIRSLSKRWTVHKWKERISALVNSNNPADIDIKTIDGEAPKLYRNMPKAEASLAIQLRTGKIGLAAFLHERRVPDYPTPFCPCGEGRQTVKHVIITCRTYEQQRLTLLRATGTDNLKDMLNNPHTLRIVAKWVMNLGVLHQFSLAKKRPIRAGK